MFYENIKDGKILCIVEKTNDGHIYMHSFDPANSGYAAYLAWLAEGNTPEPWEATNGSV